MPFVPKDVLDHLLITGTRMSNLCFNLRQRKPGDPLTEQDLATMHAEWQAWDAANRSVANEIQDRRNARRKEA